MGWYRLIKLCSFSHRTPNKGNQYRVSGHCPLSKLTYFQKAAFKSIFKSTLPFSLKIISYKLRDSESPTSTTYHVSKTLAHVQHRQQAFLSYTKLTVFFCDFCRTSGDVFKSVTFNIVFTGNKNGKLVTGFTILKS